MGISVGDLLSMDFFKDFHVIAGHKGLNREIQGVSFLEVPEGHRWSIGKELIFTSGYIFAEFECYLDKFCENFIPSHAALVIKRGSYLDKIPEKLIEIYDRNSIPLITMPYSPSWMTVVNQVNVGVLNHAIQSLRIDISQGPGCYNQNYKEQAIQKILKTLETEMEFPAFLYDVTMDKRYYSSDNFKKASEKYGIRESDYWSPQLPHTSHALCDCIHMKRYRLLKGEAANEPRISWVTIPIESAGVVQAYFCVMESRKFLDFYDEYSMRIAYLMLQGIFNQQVVARDASNIGFENLIHLAMESTPADARQLIYQADQLGLSVEQPYLCILFRHDQDELDIRSHRTSMLEAFKRCRMNRIGRVAFLSSTEGVILLNAVRLSPVNKEEIRGLILEFQKLLRGTFPDVSWFFSFTGDSGDLHDLRPHIEKCRKVLNIGRLTDSRKTLFDYDALGILTWINIPEDELGPLLKKLQKLIDSEKNQELLYTLKTYLENNLNYSLTAEKLFVNVNTVRRRIEKVNELIPVHWDDYVERTKLGLLLQYLQPGPDSIIHLKERRNGS